MCVFISPPVYLTGESYSSILIFLARSEVGIHKRKQENKKKKIKKTLALGQENDQENKKVFR